MRQLTCRCVAAAIAVVSTAAAASAQWESPAEARALVSELQSRRADAIAAEDPADTSRFVAALLLPGQLLVVNGSHPAPDAVRGRLRAGDFRGVYMDLQASRDSARRFFVHDLNADGITIAERGQPFDNVYAGADALSCDGDWKAKKLGEDEYLRRVADADARYAEMLRILVHSAAGR
jgi:hypothetical protein